MEKQRIKLVQELLKKTEAVSNPKSSCVLEGKVCMRGPGVEDQPSDNTAKNEFCNTCSGSILKADLCRCSKCDRGFHNRCLDVPINAPVGWVCSQCRVDNCSFGSQLANEVPPNSSWVPPQRAVPFPLDCNLNKPDGISKAKTSLSLGGDECLQGCSSDLTVQDGVTTSEKLMDFADMSGGAGSGLEDVGKHFEGSVECSKPSLSTEYVRRSKRGRPYRPVGGLHPNKRRAGEDSCKQPNKVPSDSLSPSFDEEDELGAKIEKFRIISSIDDDNPGKGVTVGENRKRERRGFPTGDDEGEERGEASSKGDEEKTGSPERRTNRSIGSDQKVFGSAKTEFGERKSDHLKARVVSARGSLESITNTDRARVQENVDNKESYLKLENEVSEASSGETLARIISQSVSKRKCENDLLPSNASLAHEKYFRRGASQASLQVLEVSTSGKETLELSGDVSEAAMLKKAAMAENARSRSPCITAMEIEDARTQSVGQDVRLDRPVCTQCTRGTSAEALNQANVKRGFEDHGATKPSRVVPVDSTNCGDSSPLGSSTRCLCGRLVVKNDPSMENAEEPQSVPAQGIDTSNEVLQVATDNEGLISSIESSQANAMTASYSSSLNPDSVSPRPQSSPTSVLHGKTLPEDVPVVLKPSSGSPGSASIHSEEARLLEASQSLNGNTPGASLMSSLPTTKLYDDRCNLVSVGASDLSGKSPDRSEVRLSSEQDSMMITRLEHLNTSSAAKGRKDFPMVSENTAIDTSQSFGFQKDLARPQNRACHPAVASTVDTCSAVNAVRGLNDLPGLTRNKDLEASISGSSEEKGLGPGVLQKLSVEEDDVYLRHSLAKNFICKLEVVSAYLRFIGLEDESFAGKSFLYALGQFNPCKCTERVKVCDVCGDAGYEDCLVVCSACNDGAEHKYCMQVIFEKLPDNGWLCEGCKLKEKGGNLDQVNELRNYDASELASNLKKQTNKGKSRLSAILDKARSTSQRIGSTRCNTDTETSTRRPTDDIGLTSASKRLPLESISTASAVPGSASSRGLTKESSFKKSDSGKVKFLSPNAVASIPVGGSRNSSKASGLASLSSPSLKPVVSQVGQAANKSRHIASTCVPSDSFSNFATPQGKQFPSTNKQPPVLATAPTLASGRSPGSCKFMEPVPNFLVPPRPGHTASAKVSRLGHLERTEPPASGTDANTSSSTGRGTAKGWTGSKAGKAKWVDTPRPMPQPTGIPRECPFKVDTNVLSQPRDSPGLPKRPVVSQKVGQTLEPSKQLIGVARPSTAGRLLNAQSPRDAAQHSMETHGIKGWQQDPKFLDLSRSMTPKVASVLGPQAILDRLSDDTKDSKLGRGRIQEVHGARDVSPIQGTFDENNQKGFVGASHDKVMAFADGNLQLKAPGKASATKEDAPSETAARNIRKASINKKDSNGIDHSEVGQSSSKILVATTETRCFRCKEIGHSVSTCSRNIVMTNPGDFRVNDIHAAGSIDSPNIILGVSSNSLLGQQKSGDKAAGELNGMAGLSAEPMLTTSVPGVGCRDFEPLREASKAALSVGSIKTEKNDPLAEACRTSIGASRKEECDSMISMGDSRKQEADSLFHGNRVTKYQQSGYTQSFTEGKAKLSSDARNPNLTDSSTMKVPVHKSVELADLLLGCPRKRSIALGVETEAHQADLGPQTTPVMPLRPSNEGAQASHVEIDAQAGDPSVAALQRRPLEASSLPISTVIPSTTPRFWGPPAPQRPMLAPDRAVNQDSKGIRRGAHFGHGASGPPLSGLVAPAVPEPQCLWRGGFEVVSAAVPAFYDGLQAYSSTFAAPKVRAVTKTLPQRLQLEELWRMFNADAWPKQFQQKPPTDKEIALYFFPQSERFEHGYMSLLQHMIARDLVLMGQVEGAEILIFPSQLLPGEYHCWKSKIYLWGVYRARKSNPVIATSPTDSGQTALGASVHLSTPVVSPGLSEARTSVKGNEGEAGEADMEIDMIGNKDLQKIIRKLPVNLPCPSTSPPLPRGPPPIQPPPPAQISAVQREEEAVQDTIAVEATLKEPLSPDLDAPPGFPLKQVYPQRGLPKYDRAPGGPPLYAPPSVDPTLLEVTKAEGSVTVKTRVAGEEAVACTAGGDKPELRSGQCALKAKTGVARLALPSTKSQSFSLFVPSPSPRDLADDSPFSTSRSSARRFSHSASKSPVRSSRDKWKDRSIGRASFYEIESERGREGRRHALRGRDEEGDRKTETSRERERGRDPERSREREMERERGRGRGRGRERERERERERGSERKREREREWEEEKTRDRGSGSERRDRDKDRGGGDRVIGRNRGHCREWDRDTEREKGSGWDRGSDWESDMVRAKDKKRSSSACRARQGEYRYDDQGKFRGNRYDRQARSRSLSSESLSRSLSTSKRRDTSPSIVPARRRTFKKRSSRQPSTSSSGSPDSSNQGWSRKAESLFERKSRSRGLSQDRAPIGSRGVPNVEDVDRVSRLHVDDTHLLEASVKSRQDLTSGNKGGSFVARDLALKDAASAESRENASSLSLEDVLHEVGTGQQSCLQNPPDAPQYHVFLPADSSDTQDLDTLTGGGNAGQLLSRFLDEAPGAGAGSLKVEALLEDPVEGKGETYVAAECSPYQFFPVSAGNVGDWRGASGNTCLELGLGERQGEDSHQSEPLPFFLPLEDDNVERSPEPCHKFADSIGRPLLTELPSVKSATKAERGKADDDVGSLNLTLSVPRYRKEGNAWVEIKDTDAKFGEEDVDFALTL